MENTGKKIEVTIKYSDKDIKQAISYLILKTSLMWMYLISPPIVVVIIIIYGVINGFNNYISGLMIVFIAFSFIVYVMYYRTPVDRYVNFYKKRKGGNYIFSSNEVEIIGEEFHSVYAWSIYKKAYDIPTAFLLIDEDEFVYVFPKHLFKNSKDVESLQILIAENIRDFRKS